MTQFNLYLGDCLATLRGMADDSVDSVVCDPPYLIGFMGKGWDHKDGIAGKPEVWRECLRVLKPGGHLLSFAGARTYHRITCAIEDAGFEIRDQIMYIFGSGFPKSLDVSKAIDKAAGAEREVVGVSRGKGGENLNKLSRVDGNDADDAKGCGAYGFGVRQVTIDIPITAPATDAAQQWQGWGTALKPAHEPVCVARKPLSKGNTVAANVLQWGTGAINVDGCRVGTNGGTTKGSKPKGDGKGIYGAGLHGACEINQLDAGRWPANLIHDGSEEVLAGFPQTGPAQGGKHSGRKGTRDEVGEYGFDRVEINRPTDNGGSAARYFYCAKASKADRDAGLEGFEAKAQDAAGHKTKQCNVCGCNFRDVKTGNPSCGHDDYLWTQPAARMNSHPTVKPTTLMAYLVRLVTPPGGTVLDPFMGSGSTGKACMREGFRFIGCELDPEYLEIARARIQHELDIIEAARVVAPIPQFDLFQS